MKPSNRLSICSALLLLGIASPAPAQRASDALAWFAGCWERRTPTTVVEERWTSPLGGMLFGVSRTVRRDSVLEYEFIRIYEAGDTLVYEAHPSRQARTEFRALRSAASDSAVTFANPQHDFPQRISYRLAGPDSLLARIEGTRDGRVRGVDFPYRRVPCHSGGR